MNALERLLATVLNPGGQFGAGGGTQLAAAGQTPVPTPALARAGVPTASDDQMLGVFPTAQAPMAAPARAPEAVSAPVAPVTPPRSGTASPRPSGGGIGDLLGNLFMPERAQRNQTVQWLQSQGMDEGTATLLAGNKSALQDYLLKRAQGADPKTALELQKLQLEVEEKRNPTTDDVREYQFARNQDGYKGSFTDFMREMKSAGATNVTTNIGEGDKFYDELDKANAAMFSELQQGGVVAGQNLVRLDRLGQLLENVPTGATAAFKQIAGNYGINTEGLDDIQAAQALINQLVPEQRPAGSGPMSDADLELFKQSVPRLINQPGGNRIILETMRGIALYTQQQGEIANMVANREITPAQGRKMLSELENPLSGFRGGEGSAPGSSVDDDGWRTLPNGVRVRRVN